MATKKASKVEEAVETIEPQGLRIELKEFKFVVQAVLLVEEGTRPVGERQTEPEVLYGLEQLQAWIDNFPSAIIQANIEANME